MNDTPPFIQILTCRTGKYTHVLYGLTANGAVYRWTERNVSRTDLPSWQGEWVRVENGNV